MRSQLLIQPLIFIIIGVGLLVGKNGLKINQQTCHASPDREPYYYVEQGKMHLNQGHYQQAITYYDQAICLDSNNPQPYFYRAQAHFGQGNNLVGMNNYMQGVMRAILFGGNVI